MPVRYLGKHPGHDTPAKHPGRLGQGGRLVGVKPLQSADDLLKEHGQAASGAHALLRDIPHVRHPHDGQLRGGLVGDGGEAIAPTVLALHMIREVEALVLPQLLLGFQLLGQGPLSGFGLRQHLLETLQLQLEVFDGVVGLGELPGPADGNALRLCQGTVKGGPFLGQLQGLLLQPAALRLQLLRLAGVNLGLGIECLLVPLLQLTGPLQDKLLHLCILAAKHGGKLLLACSEVLLLGVQRGLVLGPGGFGGRGQVPRRLLSFLDIG